MVHVKWVKELSHRPKVYFFDNGIRNAIVQRLDPSLISTERGHLFEQTVFQYTGPYKLHSTHRLNYNSLYEQKCTKNTCTSI